MRLRLRSTVLLFWLALVSVASAGTAYTTNTASATWSQSTHFTPNGVPGDGDTVIVASGHTLTIDGTQTIGTAGPTIAGVTAPTISTSAGGTVTSLPTGNYYLRLVPVAAGVEGSMSPESTVLALTNGTSKPQVTLPALPAGATSWSVYLTNTGASAAGVTHRRYATGKSGSTTFDLVSASYEDATVAFASAKLIAPASGIYAVGIVNFGTGASLTLKGDALTTNSSGTTMNQGSTLTFSVASGLTYFWNPGVVNSQVSPLICSGVTGSHVTITKGASAGTARIGGYGVASGFSGNGCVRATFTDFVGLGTSSVNAITTRWTSSETTSFDSCTFDSCGPLSFTNMQATASITITKTRISNSLIAGNTLTLDCGASYSSGTRSVTFNVIDKTTIFTGGGADHYVIEDNYFGNGIVFSSPTATRGWTSFKHNFWRRKSPGAAVAVPYDVSDCIIFPDGSDTVNPHIIDPCSLSRAITYSGNVFDSQICDNDGDVFLPTTAAVAGAYSLTLTNNLFLPNVNGDNIGTPITCYGNSTLSVAFDHNTYIMGNQGVSFGEAGYTGYAGMWTSVRSNVAWSPTAGSRGWVMWDGLATTFDAVAGSVANADYNAKWNFSTASPIAGQDAAALARGYLTGSSGGGNYAFASGTVPGDHDISANPLFVDSTRSLAVFDQKYLGYAQSASTWTDATAYAVGDIVTAQTSGVYFGQVVNYRCITAHTSSNGSATLGKPGLGSTGSLKSWSTYWEVASLYYIRESLIAGTTYTDVNLGVSSKSIVEVARAWIRAGFAPRNPLYFKTGHDGNTPGAVPFNFNFFFDRFIRRRTSNDVEQSTPAWRDILDTSRRTRLRKAA